MLSPWARFEQTNRRGSNKQKTKGQKGKADCKINRHSARGKRKSVREVFRMPSFAEKRSLPYKAKRRTECDKNKPNAYVSGKANVIYTR
jgi:hypothetical protein